MPRLLVSVLAVLALSASLASAALALGERQQPLRAHRQHHRRSTVSSVSSASSASSAALARPDADVKLVGLWQGQVHQHAGGVDQVWSMTLTLPELDDGVVAYYAPSIHFACLCAVYAFNSTGPQFDFGYETLTDKSSNGVHCIETGTFTLDFIDTQSYNYTEYYAGSPIATGILKQLC